MHLISVKPRADILYKANEVFKRAIDAVIHFGTERHKSFFAPSEAADIKNVMQEYGETVGQRKSVGEWLATMRRADSLLTKLNIAIHSRKLAMLPKESMTGKSGMDNIVDFQCETRSIQIHFEYQRE